MQADNTRIVVLGTGGTIAGRATSATDNVGYRAAEVGVAALLEGLTVPAGIEVLAEQVAQIDSKDMDFGVWRALAVRAAHWLAQPDIAGLVVTHGTDTLEETAYLLDLTVAGEKPVIVVGSQRPPGYRDSDAQRNLIDAVRVATSPEAAGKGTLVVMNGQINAAREVTKTSTTEREAFQSLEFGMLGVADLETVRFYRAPLRRRHLPLPANAHLGRVEIVMHYAGADGLLITSLLEHAASLDGLVIAGSGLGQVGESMLRRFWRCGSETSRS